MKQCPDYVGITCVDGHCPIANADEYAERGMDVIRNCDNCIYYKGCDDCAFHDARKQCSTNILASQIGYPLKY